MIHLFYHTGSGNHGCEAIVRTTVGMFNEPVTLWSDSIDEDFKYGVDKVVDVRSDTYVPIPRKSLQYIKCALAHKLFGSDYELIRAGHAGFLKEVHSGDICMSIGGDNYCYAGVEKLGYYNRMLKTRGAKTVLWGCSVEPSVLTPAVIRDLKSYDLITVRESCTYEGLVKAGIKDNVVLCADPAFLLEMQEIQLPKGFVNKRTVGINVSPLVAENGSLVEKNYIELIHYILEKTEDNVLLIPHVVKEGTDDRKPLSQLFYLFQGSNRIAMIEDRNCMQLKSLISKCKCFIGARTHATIAAYSTCVPTLVCGYSIKARGIARDLFGSDQQYVLPIQEIRNKEDLKDSYCWLLEHSDIIREDLQKKIPAYKEKALIAKDELNKLKETSHYL